MSAINTLPPRRNSAPTSLDKDELAQLQVQLVLAIESYKAKTVAEFLSALTKDHRRTLLLETGPVFGWHVMKFEENVYEGGWNNPLGFAMSTELYVRKRFIHPPPEMLTLLVPKLTEPQLRRVLDRTFKQEILQLGF